MNTDPIKHELSAEHISQICSSEDPLSEFEEVLMELIYEGDVESLYDVPGQLSEDAGHSHDFDEKASTCDGKKLYTTCVLTGTILQHEGGCPDLPRRSSYKSRRKFCYVLGDNFLTTSCEKTEFDPDYYPDEYY